MTINAKYNILRELFANATKIEYVKVWSKEQKKSSFYNINWLMSENNLEKSLNKFSKNDLYITFNTYKKAKKQKKFSTCRKSLFNVYAFCIDVDYKMGKNKDCSINFAIDHIKELFGKSFGNLIPQPSYIEYGNQFRLIYTIKGHLSGEKQYKAIDLVAKRIVQILNLYDGFDFCAEFQPLNSYIRIPGSYNSKEKTKFSFEWDNEMNDYVYRKEHKKMQIQYEKINCIDRSGFELNCDSSKTLGEYMEEVLGSWEKPEWYSDYIISKKSQKSKTKKTNIYNLSLLNQSRMADIKKIQSYFIQNNEEKGHRNNLCFAYFIHAKQFFPNSEKAINETEKFNDNFTYPLAHNQLLNSISSALEKNYTMKSSTILEKFSITEEIAEKLELSLHKMEFKNNSAKCKQYRERKKMEKKKHGLTKAQQISKKKTSIIKLRKQNKSSNQICCSLSITKKTYERYISELIKQKKILTKKMIVRIMSIINKKRNKISDNLFPEKLLASKDSSYNFTNETIFAENLFYFVPC